MRCEARTVAFGDPAWRCTLTARARLGGHNVCGLHAKRGAKRGFCSRPCPRGGCACVRHKLPPDLAQAVEDRFALIEFAAEVADRVLEIGDPGDENDYAVERAGA